MVRYKDYTPGRGTSGKDLSIPWFLVHRQFFVLEDLQKTHVSYFILSSVWFASHALPYFEVIYRAFKPLLTFTVRPILFTSLPWHFTCKLKALAICQETSSAPHWATRHAHMSSSCSFMCLEQAKLGKSGEPCSAARCRQNGGFAAQQASHAHLGPAAWQQPYVPPVPAHFTLPPSEGQAAQRVSGLCCAPGRPAWGREGGRRQISALAPVPEAEEPPAKSTSKTIEVNLKVSLVCLGFLLFSFPLFYCVSCLLFFVFHRFGKHFAFTAQALPSHRTAYRLCLAFVLHIKRELGNKRDIIRVWTFWFWSQ